MPKDLMIAAGKYTNKNGEQKTRWVSLGVMMENEKGVYLLLEPHINLAAFKEPNKDRIIVNVFEQKQHSNRDMSGNVVAKPRAISTEPPFDDDIPF